MTAPVLTRYPLDAAAARRRRLRIAVVLATRRGQSVDRRSRPSANGAPEGGAVHGR